MNDRKWQGKTPKEEPDTTVIVIGDSCTKRRKRKKMAGLTIDI